MNSKTISEHLQNNENLFMFIFMSQLEHYLNSITNTINFKSHFDEANVDVEFKFFIKNTILNEFNKINQDKINFSLIINGDEKNIPLSVFENYKVSNVYLPSELKPDIRNLFKLDSVIFTEPDLVLEIINDTSIFYRSIELKSTLRNSIQGSSIQQIKPFEWVIFFKETQTKKDFATGMYIHSITETMQFPDRSPRPQVSFSNLKNWNSNYRIINDDSISFLINEDSIEDKLELIDDWQNVLAKRWNDTLYSYKTSARIPWFENNLRKFILMFLEKYDSLTEEEKDIFKRKNESLIE